MAIPGRPWRAMNLGRASAHTVFAFAVAACGGATPEPVIAPPAPPPVASASPAPTTSAPSVPEKPINDRIDPARAVLNIAGPAKGTSRGEDVPAWRYIAVDQFGYRPEMKKVAVLVDPEDGFNGNDQFTPGQHLRSASLVGRRRSCFPASRRLGTTGRCRRTPAIAAGGSISLR